MARKIWTYSRVYDIAQYYVNFCTKTQFSSIKKTGFENIPKDGAVIFAPNHVAAMMDPLVILMMKHGPVGFGARSDVFKNPKVAKFMNWLRILPLARERNGLHEVAKNFETMDDIVDCLRHDVPFCMYAEGTHRPAKGLLPIKKGIFKISRKAIDDLDKPVYVVPIGVDYEYFFSPMGRLSINVGKPINVGEYLDAHSSESEANQYKGLCSTLKEDILALLGQIPERRHNLRLPRAILLIAVFPLWLACGIISLPIWVISEIILLTMEDKAWAQTVYFIVRLLLPFLWPFHSFFAYMCNHYRNYLRDLKKNSTEKKSTDNE